ncbi:MAG: hypothetical protein ACI308_00540 [Muribaculaceae bacterium]
MKIIRIFAALMTMCAVMQVSASLREVKCSGFTPGESVGSAIADLRNLAARGDWANDYKFVFKLNGKMADGSFAYDIAGKRVTFVGSDEMCASHACYTFLEDLGYTFDFTGITSPAVVKPVGQLKSRTVKPRVRWRGIRQHVNFPMDISSYSITDAKDYVRALHRMRFNKLVLHSYPGQWYETHFGDSIAYAGHFFYGDTHLVSTNKWLNGVIAANDSVFCIPEAEACFTNKAQRSRFAIDWMQQLVNYACDLGFYVQMSFEPRVTTVQQAVATARDIIATYPRINALELITEETGGWGPGCTQQQVEATLSRYFSPEIAHNSEVVAPIKPKQSDLNALYEQIGIISEAIKALESEGGSDVAYKLGIYSTITDYTRGAYRLARLALPGTPICLMSSHGSGGTADAVATLINDANDMRHTELYSWIEFDGLMYLYQNSIEGNGRLMNHLERLLPGEMIGSVLYNHWRTAENRTSARYAMTSTLQGPYSPGEFYAEYAQRLGITDVATYRKAMDLLGSADYRARKYLGNIGFCWVGAWRSGGSYVWVNSEQVANVRSTYLQAGELLEQLIGSCVEGSEALRYLSFVGNRVLCSIVYLDAFTATAQIRDVPKQSDGSYSPEAKAQVEQYCNQALRKFDQYMKIMVRMMPDRGCEGTLVSVWNAPIGGLMKYMRQTLAHEPEPVSTASDAIDAPPLPIFYGDQTQQ